MNIKEKLEKNIYFLLKAQLALESYEDDNKVQIPLIQEAYNVHQKFRDSRSVLNHEQQLKLTEMIIKKYNEAFDFIGRKNFIFYDDGDINYIWKGVKNNE